MMVGFPMGIVGIKAIVVEISGGEVAGRGRKCYPWGCGHGWQG